MSDKTCKERIAVHLASRMDDLRQLWTAYCNPGTETSTEDGNIIGGDMDGAHIYEYGLCFDYVQPEHGRGYFRYQITWGGPSDEFRIYAQGNGYKWHVDRIAYHFMDWFDGAKRTLSGKNRELIEEIFQSLFVEIGSAQAEFKKAQEY